ncbi:MAG: Gfo/Idh/MocA family oxidoreductase [Pirellulaceae bacterium]
MSRMPRRTFISSSIAGAGVALASPWLGRARASANESIVVGVMGVNGRGSSLARSFAQRPNCEVAYVCDVDSRAIGKGVGSVDGVQARTPEGVADFRRILDDESVDVLVVATPNHWHAPATILGCAHGKHVYVEKPCSHTPWEGEMAVAAARKFDRVVTMGTQRRSHTVHREAISRLHDGAIGEVLYARSWYAARRGAIGQGAAAPVPEWLDYDLWQGPCTPRPFKDNLIHYNWHWHWHWGNGELGNNGVHALDVARWGLGVDYPTRVVSAGGRYRFEDDQETLDTHMVAFEFGRKMITWEGLSWSPHGINGAGFGVTFHGSEGMMHFFDTGYRIEDQQRQVVDDQNGPNDDATHIENFLTSIRENQRPNADIEEGHKSTLLCHLGNISSRVGRALTTSAEDGKIANDDQAAALWTKEYRDGWTPSID